MTIYVWYLAAYAVQLAGLVAVALAATWALRLRTPRHALRFWQMVIAIALLMPFAQPRHATPAALLLMTESIAPAMTFPAQFATGTTAVNGALLVLVIVAAGIAGRLLWLAVGLARLRGIVARADAGSTLNDLRLDLFNALGVTGEIRITDELEGPATVGARRAIVLLPRRVLGMSAAVQRAILCHELLHVKRRDWLSTIAEELWCAVLWFHPLARAAASRLSLAREMVVDEQTILITRDRRAYAEALLAFADPQPHVIGATPFIGRRTLGQRIALIAEENPMSRHRAMFSAIVAVAASISVTAAAIDRFPMSAPVTQSQVYDPGQGVTLPRVVHEVKPQYTAAAMEKKIQGSVWLLCVVGAEGDVTDVQVSRSLDPEYGLDQAAIDAAKQWKFQPGTKDGKPVPVRVTIELTFTLKK